VPKAEHTTLTVVRIGTSGGLQEEDPVGAYVASEYSIGFDGVLHFYADADKVTDKPFEEALLKGLDWKISGLKPYVVRNDESLFHQITDGTDIIHGVTISANGFYVPQGRKVRSQPLDPDLNRKIMDFEYRGHKITNFEMEGAALAGIGNILGHRCLTVCTIIAGRKKQDMNTSYKDTLDGLIDTVLDRI
jgi:uridine phosphorylase